MFGLALDFTGISKAYGDTFDISSYAAASNVAASFSSDTPATCAVAGTTVTTLGAGTCTITAQQAKPLTDPLVPPVQRSFTVQKKTLTVVAGTPPSQPQGTASAPTVTCTAAFVGADTFVTSPTGGVYTINGRTQGDTTYNTTYIPITVGASTTAGNYVTQCTGGTVGGNYTIGGYTKGTFTIGPPAPPTLTITANSKRYTYGTAPPALDVTYSSSTIARTGTLSCGVYAKSDTGFASPLALSSTTPVVAGGYAIRCSGITSASNPVAWVNGTLIVDPASVAVTASSPTTQAHSATVAPGVTCAATGFVGADSFVTSPTGAVYDASGNDQVSIGSTASAGEYVTKCAGGDPGSNYTISGYTPGTFTVRDTTAPAISGTPGDQTAEAIGPDGAGVTYTIPTANDLVDGSRTVTCAPATGGTFAISATTVTCSASDTSGNSASTSFTVTVRDTTKPVVTAPAGITAEATSADGAVATFNATASDTVTANLTVSCTSVPGSAFKLGDTAVTCSATDAAGNTGSAGFTVTVRDTTPPDTSLTGTPPANPTKQTGASFTFSGTDNVGVASFECTLDGGAFAACTSPKSYSGLAEGNHIFQVRARDAAGNATQTPAKHTWTIDTTSPVITAGNVTVDATGPAGATVTFAASATDANPASPAVTCTPASGGTFAIGTTTVKCSATDAAGNTGSASFTVTVKSVGTQLTDLQAKVQSLPLDPTARKNLQSTLQNAQAAAGKGDIPATCDKLTSFVSQVQALSGKKIATPAADGLLIDARRIMAVLGCP